LFYLYFYPKAPLQAGRRSFAKSLVLRLVKEFISSLKKAAALWLLAGQKGALSASSYPQLMFV